MSGARTVPSVAPVEQRKPGRVVYRTLCEKHGVEYGREMVPATQEHESYLIGNCSRCLEEARIHAEWEEKLSSLHAEVKAETDAQCNAEEGRASRILELAHQAMNEERIKRFEKWCLEEERIFAFLQADFIARADSEDRERMDAENIEKRRVAFFEERKAVAAQADAEIQKTLDTERERRAKNSLAAWVPFT